MVFNVNGMEYENNTSEINNLLPLIKKKKKFDLNYCISAKTRENFISGGSFADIFYISEEHVMKVCNSSNYNFLECSMELMILTQLSHSSILGATDFFRRSKSIIYILPYFESPLENMIPHSLEQKNKICKQLASAVNYLHSKCILHLDICPNNILIKQVNGEYLAVLCDFSLSLVCIDDNIISSGANITATYRPYENLNGSRCYSEKSDIWSLGLVFYKIHTGKDMFNNLLLPSENANNTDYEINTKFEIEQLKSWGSWPCTNDPIICKMLELDPILRIQSEELCLLLGENTFYRQNFTQQKLTPSVNWAHTQTVFKSTDTISASQTEILFKLVLKNNKLNNIVLDKNDKKDFFMACFAIVRFCFSGAFSEDIECPDLIFNRVYDIFIASKGNFLSYS